MGITAPSSRSFLSGLSTAFATGAGHKLEKGAMIQEIVALHLRIGHFSSSPSVSTQIAALRRLLFGGGGKSELGSRFKQVTEVSANWLSLVAPDHVHTGNNDFSSSSGECRYHEFIDSTEAGS